MNEKEKKAIERCNQLRQVEHANWIGISNQLAIITVLNLIEKQQAEIERLTTNNEILQGELDRIGVKTLKLEVGSSTDDIIAEIEKKDKIIDLMAEQLTTPVHSKEWVIEHFSQKIEKGE